MGKARVRQPWDRKILLRQCVKLAFAVGLIYWLITTGRLDFFRLKLAYSDSSILFGALFVWVFGLGVCATWRWLLLMRGIGLEAKFWRCCQLTLIGAFFNTVLFGTVGGDLIRGIYAFRDNRSRGRAAPAMTVLIDRVTGLYALFLIGVCGILSNLSAIESQPQLVPSAIFIIGMFIVLTLGLISIQISGEKGLGHLITKLSQLRIVPRSVRSLYLAGRSYQDGRAYLIGAIFISVLIQGQMILFYWYVAEQVTQKLVPLNLAALVVPIGTLITAVPISPGGLGVGHAAFERLFGLIGVGDGANIFNIVILGQMAMNLLGSIPYLFLRSEQER